MDIYCNDLLTNSCFNSNRIPDWLKMRNNNWVEAKVRFNWRQKLQVLFKKEVIIRFERCNIVDLRQSIRKTKENKDE